ncbi:hypothetical protein [Ureibacillus chungkukjangi]|uniref:Uncharacterized protein n=1 Tax=Ureibacillus chungkukjangi TaxID=1202712 RepID=A0A318TMC5_9BACL|nr:hypothetical protein [Ureibacillus chungkukjangi]PYF04218.1 hypothetical protein BJ095_1255 [Ureibacillus chungkukjangi]
MFASLLSLQLRTLINQPIRVAVGETLFTGTLLSISGNILTLTESTDSYERATRRISVNLRQVSFIQVSA